MVEPGGRPPAAGLYASVVMVVHLMRRNPVQAVAAEIFGVSQATVSRRWDLPAPDHPPGARGCDLREVDTAFNLDFSGIRAAIERAVATFKTWRMLSKEGGRYRPPIDKFEETLNAIIRLMSLATYE